MFKDTTGFLPIEPVEAPADIELKPWQSLLLKAAALIEEKGWTKDKFKHGPRHCAVGAMRVAAGRPADPDNQRDSRALITAENRLLKVMKKVEPTAVSVPDFNDEYAKSGKQVAALMREAAGVKNAAKQ